MTTTASRARGTRTSRSRAALKTAPKAEEPTGATPEPPVDATKTLLGNGVGKHTAAALVPAPLPPRGPSDCPLCGEPVPTEKVSWPFRPEPSPSGKVREYRCCPDIGPCLERAFSRPSKTPGAPEADKPPSGAPEQAPEATGDALEPLPGEGE